jgi:TPR repeat protein
MSSSAVSSQVNRATCVLSLDEEEKEMTEASVRATQAAQNALALQGLSNPHLAARFTQKLAQILRSDQPQVKTVSLTLPNRQEPHKPLQVSLLIPALPDKILGSLQQPTTTFDLSSLLPASLAVNLAKYPEILEAYGTYRLGGAADLPALDEEGIETLIRFSHLIGDHGFAASFPAVIPAILRSRVAKKFTKHLFEPIILGKVALDDRSKDYATLENFVTNPWLWQASLTEEQIKKWIKAAEEGHPIARCAFIIANKRKVIDHPKADRQAKAFSSHLPDDEVYKNHILAVIYSSNLEIRSNARENIRNKVICSPYGKYLLNYPDCGVYYSDLPISSVRYSMVEEAANEGNIQAMCEQAWRSNDREEKDQFLFWFKKAADKEDAIAMHMLGRHYMKEESGAHQDEALKYYRKACKQGYTLAMYELSQYLEGKSPEFAEEAALWLRKAAALGYSDAMVTLGNRAELAKDLSKALEYYKKAAERKNAKGMLNYAWCLANGIGTIDGRPDAIQANEWFSRAYKTDDKDAVNTMGFLLQHGILFEKDVDTAVSCFEDALEGGADFADFNLALCYALGLGTEKNEEFGACCLMDRYYEGYRKRKDEKGFVDHIQRYVLNLAAFYSEGKIAKEYMIGALNFIYKTLDKELVDVKDARWASGLSTTATSEEILEWINQVTAPQGQVSSGLPEEMATAGSEAASSSNKRSLENAEDTPPEKKQKPNPE